MYDTYNKSKLSRMRNIYLLLYLLLVVICLYACHEPVPEYISYVENIIEKKPDSALIILDSLEEQIRKEPLSTRMYYNLLVAEACDKCDIPNPYDSLLSDVVRYYEERKESDKLMKAYYFMGQRHLELKAEDDPAALLYSFRALEQSAKVKDDAFIGRIYNQIGKSFVYMNLFKEAIRELQMACSYSLAGNDKQACIDVLCNLADVYNLQNQTDSALYYYQKAYKQSELCGDMLDKKVDIGQNMADAYIKTGNNDKAREILEKITNEEKDSNKLNYNALGNLFLHNGQKDSAVVYFKCGLENEDWAEKKYACWNLYQIVKKDKDCERALAYLEKYAECSDSTYAQSNIKSLQKIKVLYDLHHMEKEKEELRQENAKQRAWIICVMVTMAVVVGVTIQYNRMKKEAACKQEEVLRNIYEEQYRKSKQYIESNKQVIKELEGKIDSIQQEKDMLCKELLLVQKEKLEQTNQAIETLQKQQALLEEALRKSDIYAYCYQAIENPTIVLTGSDWKKLEQVVNETYDGFTNRLFILHPSITTIELRICLLLKIRLPASAISQLICRTQSAVSMSRKLLYKKIFHKEGIPAKLDEFIVSF